MMRLPQVLDLGAREGLTTVSIADLALWRLVNDPGADESGLPADTPGQARVHRVATTTLPTVHGTFTAHGYRDLRTGAVTRATPGETEGRGVPIQTCISAAAGACVIDH